ncbi:response regulator [Nocardioides marmoribigeumensis]
MVLVVDDDDSVREITQLSLEAVAGWQVRAAGSGSRALEMLRERRPEVVLLDVMMPGMDGPTTFRAMQADPELRDVPVVLLTAKVRMGSVQPWDDLGVAGVIAKPFDPMSLAHEVSALVGWDAAG